MPVMCNLNIILLLQDSIKHSFFNISLCSIFSFYCFQLPNGHLFSKHKPSSLLPPTHWPTLEKLMSESVKMFICQKVPDDA